nr:MAG TPA: hypothetical protein [Caudoviricetes sp.]
MVVELRVAAWWKTPGGFSQKGSPIYRKGQDKIS